MKKFKRLNRKGFTLIELLAVIVILAVVMTIATTAVLSAMNNSRKSGLEDTSIALQRAFQTKYSEAMVTNTLSDIYSDVLSSNNGFDFTSATSGSPVFYSIPSGLSDELNLAGTAYLLDGTTKPVTYTAADSKVTVKGTFVAFDGDKVVVCAIANRTGNMYVANEANTSTAKIFNTTVTFDGSDDYTTFMWTCSDGQTSWKNAGSQTS